MTTQLAKQALTGDLILPDAKSDAAVAIRDKIDLMLALLPTGTESRQFAIAALTEINKLSRPCSIASVGACVANCAALGLIPGPALGHAFFVPYKDVCTLIVGYKGFLDLAFTNQFLAGIHPDVVLRDEPFRYWKDERGPHLEHDATDRILNDVVPTEQNIKAAYCQYTTKAGTTGIKFVSAKELQRLKAKADPRSPWKSGSYEEMSLKTAVRRAAKQWKLTGRLARAIMLDEQAERGEQQTCDVPIDLGRAQAPVADFLRLDDDEPPPEEPEPSATEQTAAPPDDSGPPSLLDQYLEQIDQAQDAEALRSIEKRYIMDAQAKVLTDAELKALRDAKKRRTFA